MVFVFLNLKREVDLKKKLEYFRIQDLCKMNNQNKRDAPMDPTDDPMDDIDDPMQDDNELPFMSDAIQDEADRDQAELEADALLQDDEGGDSDEAGEDLFASDMERYVFKF
jgi:hypothetical protein